ncbi:DUF6185 family protein [Streptomyces sp. NPDC002888]|uniref:DUF6185 family protein n=1 Tax=Streptomyces sp. NPDC002888 TaxID=3364668 RepID=UPI0036C8A610
MRRVLSLFGFVGLFVGALIGSGPPAVAADDACLAGQLKAAQVSVSVRLKHNGEDYTKAESRMVVRVPKSWKPAPDLLLNGDTERYRTAMRCVLRYPDDPYPFRDTEARPWPPKVTVKEKWITLEQRAVTYVDDVRDRDFGAWRITVGKRFWTLNLMRPPALDKAWWQEITVDLGGRAARTVFPTPTEGSATHLTWNRAKVGGKPPEVQVRLQPPAAKALVTQWREKPRYVVESLAWLTWDLTLFPALLLLARMLLRSPVGSPETPAEEATRRNLFLWAWLTFAAALAFELDDRMPDLAGDYGVLTWWPTYRVAIHFVLAVCVGAALCLFGRPQVHAVVAALVAAAYPVVVACAPQLFGLPAGFWLNEYDVEDVERLRQTGGFLWLALACACVAFVWLVGTVSALSRLRWAVHVQSSGTPGRYRFPWWALVLCAVLAVATVAVGVWAAQNSWKQESWLSAHDDHYGRWHLTYLYNKLAWFPSEWPDWFDPAISSWYPLLGALLAVLAARTAAPGASAFAPRVPEILIITVFFLEASALTPGWYVGLWMPLLSVPLILVTGFFLLDLGNRRSVLSRKLESGTRLRAAIRESDRQWLIESARKHRDLHAQLRRVEQGDQDSERDELEEKLDELHRWNPGDTTSPHRDEPLPDSVDAVELALAWGPRDTWWRNACRAACFAALLGLPATGIKFWADRVRGPLWGNVARDRFGVPDLVDYIITSEISWAVAGFLLGALWRVLPGRRGPAKGLGLSLVYATPVAAHWLISRAVGQSIGTWGLHVALTVLVLTSTGVAMDIDTFRREAHYWPTKAGLLLSVYQLRTASVQLAFFVAQVVALVGVWQQLKGNDPMVLIQRQDPTGTQGGPGTGGSP